MSDDSCVQQDDKTGMFITAIYNLILHREPDSEGFQNYYHVFCIPVEIDHCLKSFINSQERQKLFYIHPNSKPIRPNMSYDDIIKYAIEHSCSDTYIDTIKIEYCLTFADYHDGLEFIKNENRELQLEYRIRLINQLGFSDLIAQEYIFLNSAAKFGWNIISQNCLLSINIPMWEKTVSNNTTSVQDALSIQRNTLKKNLSFLSDSLSSLLIENCDSFTCDQIIDLFGAIASIKGLTKNEKIICNEIVNNILHNKKYDVTCIDEISNCRLTFISGCCYSGSSAIYDYLRGHYYFCDCFAADYFPLQNEHEIAFIANTYGLSSIHKSMSSQEAIFRRDLIKFFLYHILTWHIPFDNFSMNTRVFYSITQAFIESNKYFEQYLNIVNVWIKNILNIYLYKSTYDNNNELIFQQIIFRFIELLHGKLYPSKCFILNNAIMLPRVKDALYIFPHGTVYIAVFRDPRDHYISCIMRNFITNVSEYVTYMKTILSDFSQLNAQYFEKYKIIPVNYERFVQNEDYRVQLSQKLGCSEKFESAYFDPKFSITRIGKYKNYEDQDAIRKVEEAFPELMSGEYFSQFKENF